jgi:uroporphyrinogen-III synthase
VWVTRASPGAEATARRLSELGFVPHVAPLLRLEALAGGPIDLTGVAALAFTSANGVAAFVARAEGRDLPVYTVGAATAAAARAAGFARVVSADGDVEALAPRIAADGRLAGVVLHPGAAEPAGDLVGDLTARGVAARGLVVYETRPAPPGPDLAATLAGADAVLLHSPRAARVLAQALASGAAPGVGAGRLTAVCLSPRVAAPLVGLGLAEVHIAAAPTEAVLLESLQEAHARAARSR